MKSLLPFDELNALVMTSVVNAQSADEVKEDMKSILVNAYKDGVDSVGEMLEMDLMYGTSEMGDLIFKPLGGKTINDRLNERVDSGDIEGLILLMDSEVHRVFSGAQMDGAKQAASKTTGEITKTWVTKRDDRVRDTHEYIDGITLPWNSEFYTFDGDHAYYPGGFSNVSNNANCRCVLEFRRQ